MPATACISGEPPTAKMHIANTSLSLSQMQHTDTDIIPTNSQTDSQDDSNSTPRTSTLGMYKAQLS